MNVKLVVSNAGNRTNELWPTCRPLSAVPLHLRHDQYSRKHEEEQWGGSCRTVCTCASVHCLKMPTETALVAFLNIFEST